MDVATIFKKISGKTFFITGDTGFKGNWLTFLILKNGGKVIGYSEDNKFRPYFNFINEDKNYLFIRGDIRDYSCLEKTLKIHSPDYLIHLAAQPLVQEGYQNPLKTYTANFNGTLNILELLRNKVGGINSSILATTDKVYQNDEVNGYRYKENDILNGLDPYSNSKSLCELSFNTYKKCFFDNEKIRVSTVRSGNVIGGGDFSENRIIPDCFRAISNNKELILRNPYSTRPYQHVLDPLLGYLDLLFTQEDSSYEICDSYNIGPDNESDNLTTESLVELFYQKWGIMRKICSENMKKNLGKESNFLALEITKIKNSIGWYPRIKIDKAVGMTAQWYKCYTEKGDLEGLMEKQLSEIGK